jgi:uncharacterized protein (TIGR02391 family)
MNLQTEISQELWSAVASAYEAGNYSHAILEAVHHVSSILRERAGVDGDGASLVGQALGGDSPRLRVNSLQTDTERNVQKGLEQILRGIYLAIRNPRSHEQTTDTKQTTDTIVTFLDFLLKLLNASQQAFTPDSFVARVLDPEFVESSRYAELLIAEIPAQKRGDALIALYHNRRRVDLRKLRHLIRGLLSHLSENQIVSYLAVASEELRTTTDEAAIRTTLQMLTPELWPRLAEVARLRIENKLIAGVTNGEIFQGGKTTQPLATWSNIFLRAFTLRQEAATILVRKLEDEDADDRHYVAKFFMLYLPEIISTEQLVDRCVRAIASAIMAEDEKVRSALIGAVRTYPQEWQTKLAVALKEFTDPENPAVVLNDGTPLLSSPTQDEFPEDDIPF